VSKPEYPYPEDEFDSLGADRTPSGVHRAPLPRWRALLPFIVALILAPTLAYLGVTYLSSAGSSTPAPTSAASEQPAPEETSTPEATETPAPAETAEPTPTPTPIGDVRLDTAVFVLNGTPTVGLGTTAAETLTTDGFTNVTADDYGNRLPTVSTVYYNNADLADTAVRVAEILGIDQLLELADATDTIAVVLRTDYAPAP
jgi:hypothetical protein